MTTLPTSPHPASIAVKASGLVPYLCPEVSGLPDLIVEFETMGADEVVYGEHLLYGADMDHPLRAGPVVNSRTEKHSDVLDVLMLFSASAAKTSTIRFSSSIILAASHSFAVLAKQAATLDVLSHGRFMLGVGSGWYRTETEAAGIPFEERVARVEETVEACQALWAPGPASYLGRWIRFENMICEPATVSKGGVPVWWGANAAIPAVARRVVRLAEGWIAPEAASYDDIARSIEGIHLACAQQNRNPSQLGFRATLPTPAGDAMGLEELFGFALRGKEHLASIGITHFTVPLNSYRLTMAQIGDLIAVLKDS
jgi:probable F420-dependent oxidoreductase